MNGYRVQIDNTENTLVLLLVADPRGQRAKKISDVQVAGRLNAREYACFHVVE